MDELRQDEKAQGLEGEARGEIPEEIREARATYQLQPETLASEGVDESGAGAQLDQMVVELSRLSKQVAEMQEQLSSTIQQRYGAPPRGETDRAREITFREFLGAIWW